MTERWRVSEPRVEDLIKIVGTLGKEIRKTLL